MLDPRQLKKGWQIQLKQDSEFKWKEYLLNSEGQIVAVEDIDPFKYSKEKMATPNNYEELKKNYKYLSKTEQSPPPIVQNEPLPPFELEPPEPMENNEPHECDRECPTAPCSICGSDAPDICEPKDSNPDQDIKENPEPEEK